MDKYLNNSNLANFFADSSNGYVTFGHWQWDILPQIKFNVCFTKLNKCSNIVYDLTIKTSQLSLHFLLFHLELYCSCFQINMIIATNIILVFTKKLDALKVTGSSGKIIAKKFPQ